MKVYEFKKAGKTTLTLDGNFVKIKRKGTLNFLNHGLDGEKVIDINTMTGVQMKQASSLTNGYIQFIFMGSRESKGGLLAAANDENTIMYAKKEQQMANEIKSYIENMLSNKTSGAVQEIKVDVSEEIRKFKSLLEEGIITEEEYEKKKKQLLGL